MGITLFWYVFKNLAKVFLMASGVIAGIMSFGGLLKPLMDNGLDLGQVGKMLAYAMPAMTTYSYPIAALFACTVVYGRLAAENEVTGFRAAGISMGPLGLGFPALVGGVIVSLASLVALSWIVPAASMGMERTAVSNLGQIMVNRITQQHQIKLDQAGSQPLTIYARAAQLEPPDPAHPADQIVTMTGVSIVTFDKTATDKDKNALAVPEEFYLAKTARAYIQQPPEGDDAAPVQFVATLSDGLKFPRQVTGRQDAAMQGGVKTQQFGPFPLESRLKENTKFMDIKTLKDLQEFPEKSKRMQTSLADLVRSDQQDKYLRSLQTEMAGGPGFAQFSAAGGDRYTLMPGPVPPRVERNRLVLESARGGPEAVRLIQTRGGNLPSLEWVAREARLRAYPDSERKTLAVSVELQDATLHIEGEENARDSLERSFTVTMPTDVSAIAGQTVKQYISRPDLPATSAQKLGRNLMKQNNSVISEMHSRISFALSCVVLTLVGYGLGVMFKSGNYLNAFAVSIVPALVSIVLVVTGQHICENVPPDIVKSFHNPLNLGLAVIWIGNIAVTILAFVLLTRLRRM
ncbi:MAG: lipopolysaccharide transporter permease LptF [Phycisphaerales bacterium]|nr:lipopolysaccharide transporter permease LptF [Phycisphaerales bacterium]